MREDGATCGVCVDARDREDIADFVDAIDELDAQVRITVWMWMATLVTCRSSIFNAPVRPHALLAGNATFLHVLRRLSNPSRRP